jgi:hypothetical protein
MNKTDGTWDFLAGQNAFDVFVPANDNVDVKTMGAYDETINNVFRDQVRSYAEGSKDLDTAVQDFKEGVANVIDVEID